MFEWHVESDKVCVCTYMRAEARWILVADVDDMRSGGSDFPLDFLLIQSFISSPPMKISPNHSQHTTNWNRASLLMGNIYKHQSDFCYHPLRKTSPRNTDFNIFSLELRHDLTLLTKSRPVVWKEPETEVRDEARLAFVSVFMISLWLAWNLEKSNHALVQKACMFFRRLGWLNTMRVKWLLLEHFEMFKVASVS